MRSLRSYRFEINCLNADESYCLTSSVFLNGITSTSQTVVTNSLRKTCSSDNAGDAVRLRERNEK